MKTGSRLVNELLKKSLVLGGVFLFLTGTAQMTDSDNDFKKCDKNKDKKISQSEFSDRYSNDDNLTGDNQDVQYDENKFYESSYDLWDENKDSRLSEDEWKTGYDASYGEYLDGDFSSYDVNQNGYLEIEEYQRALLDSDYYSSWDTNQDNSLDNEEYSAVVFQCADKNGDSYIDEDEYKEYNEKNDSSMR